MNLITVKTKLNELEVNIDNLEEEIESILQHQQDFSIKELNDTPDYPNKRISTIYHSLKANHNFKKDQNKELGYLNEDVETVLDYINILNRQTETLVNVNPDIEHIKDLSNAIEYRLKEPDTLINDIDLSHNLSNTNILDILNYRLASALIRTQSLTTHPISEIEGLAKKVEDFERYSKLLKSSLDDLPQHS